MILVVMRAPQDPEDREAGLHDLFIAHYPQLLRLASFLLSDQQAGEEVVQDAFVLLHRHWSRVRNPDAAPGYLRTTVVNLSRSALRRRALARRRVPTAMTHSGPADEGALLREDQSEVLTALRSLPRRQRECLALRFYLDLSETEIAASLGISVGSVKSHTHRGLAKLATKLEALK